MGGAPAVTVVIDARARQPRDAIRIGALGLCLRPRARPGCRQQVAAAGGRAAAAPLVREGDPQPGPTRRQPIAEAVAGGQAERGLVPGEQQVGKRDSTQTLQLAATRFRALPLGRLTREELASNTPDPAMHAKTDAAVLGATHAFASHCKPRSDSNLDCHPS